MTRQRDGLDHIGVDKRQSGYLLVEYQKDAQFQRPYTVRSDDQSEALRGGDSQICESVVHPTHPLIPDGSVALGRFFAKITSERPRARVVVHQIIAVGDYVWAHLNFLNLFNDDPDDTGIAGVDIYRMDAEGKAVEHWDTLQLVGTPQNSAPMIAPNIPRANANGMF
jgi:predicted SnoaL-like aldol condensation-catalyzing enzyme